MRLRRRDFFKALAAAVVAPKLPGLLKPQIEQFRITQPALDVKALIEKSYELARNQRHSSIDVFCDRETAEQLRQAFERYASST